MKKLLLVTFAVVATLVACAGSPPAPAPAPQPAPVVPVPLHGPEPIPTASTPVAANALASTAAPTDAGTDGGGGGRAEASIANDTLKDTKVFVAFGSDSIVLPTDWSFCTATTKLNCEFPLKAKTSQPLPLSGKYLNATFTFGGPVSCHSTKAELNINNPKWYDIADVSLVDGYSNEIEITVDDKGTKTALGPPKGATGNEKVFGVYPLGCDICTARQSPPCGMKPGKEGCKTGTQYKPDVPCQFQGSVMGGGSAFRVAFTK